MNKYTVTILVLCFSAAVLAAVLIGSYATQPAQAGSSASRSGSGEYILGAVSVSDTMDVITVIDVGTQRMMIYAPDRTGSPSRIDTAGDIDLRRAFPSR